MTDYTPTPATVLYEAAIRYHRAGHVVLPNDPIRKHPVGYKWQELVPDEGQIKSWYYDAKIGAIGLRDVEVLDFDNHGKPSADDLLDQWEAIVRALAPNLLPRLVYETTPSGGWHIGWKCHIIAGNQRLATRPTFDEETGANWSRISVTLIETRGKGGQVQVSPSPGYKLVRGDWANLPEITANERQILLDAARSLSQGDRKLTASFSEPQGRPGDVYNRDNGHKAWEILQEIGWTLIYQRDEVMYLRRPGKTIGVSATLGHVAPNVLYVFSTNASPFQGGKAYTPFAVYSEVLHRGNYSAAAASLEQIRLVSQSPTPIKVDPVTGEIIEVPEGPKKEIISASRLARMTFDPMRWTVDGLLPEGVTILAGRPKVKKSWLALSVAVAVASGGKAFGWFETRQGGVLYLDLESNQRRMRSRLAQLIGDPDSSAWPENLFIATDWPAGDAAIKELDTFLTDNPTQLVIIDILARVRPPKSPRLDSYDQDYVFLQALNACADRHRVSILVLHHTRKAKGEDIFEDVSGTTALTGAASTTWVLARSTEEEDMFALSMRGRDLYEEGNVELRWDEYESRHIYGGVTVGSSSVSERSALLKLVEIGKTYSFLDIVQRSGKKKAAVNNLLRRLLDDGLLLRVGRGQYQRREAISGQRSVITNPNEPKMIHVDELEPEEFEVVIDQEENATNAQYHVAPFGHLWKVWAPHQVQTLHIYDSRERAQETADRYNRQGGHQ